MPPANTPNAASAERSPVRSQTSAILRSLTPLSYLSSPAPNLASTLVTSQAAEEADAANVTFLRDSLESLDQAVHEPRRSHVDAQRDPRRPTDAVTHDNGSAIRQGREETAEDLSRRERLQRVLARLNRIYEPSASSTAAYSNRTPSPNRQSLYDWAPSYEDGYAVENELDAVLGEMRRQQPDTHPRLLSAVREGQLASHRQQSENGEHTPTIDANETNTERRDRRREQGERRSRDNDWVNLRSRLQRTRQDGAGSPSTTAGMLRYVMDRERSGVSEEEERARGTGWFRPDLGRPSDQDDRDRDLTVSNNGLSHSSSNEPRERDRQERLEIFRRGYLADSTSSRLPREAIPPIPRASDDSNNPSPLAYLEDALKYLSAMRFRGSYSRRASRNVKEAYGARGRNESNAAISSFDDLLPLPSSSWLQPGSVFEGYQRAAPVSAHLTRPDPRSAMRVDQINPNYRSTVSTAGSFDHPPGSTRVTPFEGLWHRELNQTSIPSTSSAKRFDASKNQWPVRVTIHAIDTDKMILQGTMEAYDVPQHPVNLGGPHTQGQLRTAGKKHAPITTYLEGHIIDFRTHSLITPGADDHTRKTGPYATSPMNATPYTSTDDSITFPSANVHTDAQNWLRLPPFCNIPSVSASVSSLTRTSSQEDQIADLLLSPTQLNALNQEYVFMRWKERCFVHQKNDVCTATTTDRSSDRDRGHGLTISGFYYISLRRSDGRVEGLYFDPTSTPYQHLRLDGARGGWGAWSFK